MPHRCVAGGCSNMRKDGVSLHKWPEDLNVAKQWTKAVKNTRSDFFNPATGHICSAHFTADSFEDQSLIAKSPLTVTAKQNKKKPLAPRVNCTAM